MNGASKAFLYGILLLFVSGCSNEANQQDEKQEVMEVQLLEGAGSDLWILKGDRLYWMEAQNLMVSDGMYLNIFMDQQESAKDDSDQLAGIQKVEIADKPTDNRYGAAALVLEELLNSNESLLMEADEIAVNLQDLDLLDELSRQRLFLFLQEHYPSSAKWTLIEDGKNNEMDESVQSGILIEISSQGQETNAVLHAVLKKGNQEVENLSFRAVYENEQWNVSYLP